MFMFQEQEETTERITVLCNENDCDGVFILNRDRGDFSPRVHDECSKCKRFMSVKLRCIEESRILKREWI